MKYIITNGVPTAKTGGDIPGLVTADPTAELDAAYAAYCANLPPPPPAIDPLAERATALLSDPANGANVRVAVLTFLGQVQALAWAGVDLPDPLTFAGIAAAIKARWTNDVPTATAAALELRNAWDGVVYHCGTLKDADELFAYLAAVIMGGNP